MSEQINDQELLDVSDAEENSTVERCLTFESGDLILYISTKHVIEIINNHSITPLPLVAPYIKGIINLRGQIIPVIDLRLRLGKMPQEDCCIMVVNVENESISILVDGVDKMVDVFPNSILPMPTQNPQKLISGMCSLPDGKTLLILDCGLLLHE